jgi:predicted NodU family carbamoyl transferase
MEAAKADEVVCAISDDITHREAAQAEDLTRLKAAVEELGQREKFEKKWVAEMLLQLVEPNGQLTAVDVLKQILDSTETIQVYLSKRVQRAQLTYVLQINASNAKMGEILKLFSLKEAKQIWTLLSNEEHDVPNFVCKHHLEHLCSIL